ncbi:acyltransferase family protein [Xanthobacter wiegelii]|uniref:acyltransferase family protein n=1 Tax=Xanthobacter wiegelii TaxID=3119913 RepID=UPI00372A121B
MTTGFDYLRVILSVFILWWHSVGLATGDSALDARIWSSPFRFMPAALVPMFFALSGYLVAGSLQRNPVHRFLMLRAIRIFPALVVEVTLSAVVVGAIFTTLSPLSYYTSWGFFRYMLNIVGLVKINLPGVFPNNPYPELINGQLWTIPFEFECYLTLAALAVLGIVSRRRWLLALIAVSAVLFTAWALIMDPLSATTHMPGRAFVFAFLFGVLVFNFRDKLPYNDVAGVLAIALSVLCLNIPALAYVAGAPMAYVTVWLGLKQPPAIKFGDLSYGIFLFHFPVLQVIIALSHNALPWWGLAIFATPVTALVALGSWNLVERPVLLRKKFFIDQSDRMLAGATRLIAGTKRRLGWI